MRASQASNNAEPVQPSSARSTSAMRASQSTNNAEPVQPPSARSMRSSQSTNNFEQPQPPSARSNSSMRSSQSTSSMEQPLSARANSAMRPNLGVKPVAMVPPTVPLSLRPTSSGIPTESQHENKRDKRYTEALNFLKHQNPMGMVSLMVPFLHYCPLYVILLIIIKRVFECLTALFFHGRFRCPRVHTFRMYWYLVFFHVKLALA